MSNLYKQRNIVAGNQSARIIDTNELLALKLEAQRRAEVQDSEEEQTEPEAAEPEISLEEIRDQAEQILQEAHAQAEDMIEKARGQVEEICEGARKEGWQKGYQEGQEKAKEELGVERQKLDQHREALNSQHQQRLQEMEGQVLEAVCDVVERVFNVCFDEYGAILLHLVEQAVQQIESTKEFTVRVHPEQYGYLKDHRQELISQVGPSVQIQLEADASIEDSGCVIETDSGFFDCSLGVQLENLIKAIRMLSV